MAIFKSGKHDAGKRAQEAQEAERVHEAEAPEETRALDAAGDASEAGDASGPDAAPEADATVVLSSSESDGARAAAGDVDETAAEQAMESLYDKEPEPAPLESLEVIGSDDEDTEGAGEAADADTDAAASGASKPHKNRRKVAAIVVVVFALVLAGVYCGGALYFERNFMPNTTVAGQDVSGTSVEALARQVSETGKKYSAKVSGDGLNLTIDGSDVGLSYDGEAYAQAAVEQTDPWRWPFEIGQTRTIEVERQVTLDEDKLKAILQPMITKINRDGTDPESASVGYDSSVQRFAVSKEKLGTKVDQAAAIAKVADGMRELEPSIELGNSELKQPKLVSTDENLVAAAEKANEYLKARVPLTVNGKTVMTVEPVQVAEWVKIDSDFNANLDEDAIKTWCYGPVSAKYDTIGKKRVYKRADGKKVTVSGGTYGWSTDSEKLAAKLAKRIKAGSSKKLEIPMKSKGTKWNPGGADWKAYIDIDLTEQKARYYNAKGKVVWSSDIVSGNTSEKHDTPTGVYVINNTMGTNQTLIGTDADGDGKPDYKSHVDYWMPFVGNLVALHDADWRSSFGGTIYKTNGSHGCVNLPPAKAKALYKMVKPGVVVSCHK